MPDMDKRLTKRALDLYLLTTQCHATSKHHITSTKSLQVNYEQFENLYFPITKFVLTQLILVNLMQILNSFYIYLVFSTHNPKLEILGCRNSKYCYLYLAQGKELRTLNNEMNLQNMITYK